MTASNPAPTRRPRNRATLRLTAMTLLLFLNLIGQAYTGYDTDHRNKLADDRVPAYSARVDEAKKPVALPGRDCWPDDSKASGCNV